MKTLTTIFALLFILTVNSFGQGKLILTPSVDYNFDTKEPSGSLLVGVAGVNASSLELGANYRDDYVSGVLSGTVYPFSFGLGLNAKALYTYGEMLGEAKQGRPYTKNGVICGYRPDTRELSDRTKLFGSVGAVVKYQNLRLYGDVILNDYDPSKWNEKKGTGNPYTRETVKAGVAYVFALKRY